MEVKKFEQEEKFSICEDCKSLLSKRYGFYICPNCGLIAREILKKNTTKLKFFKANEEQVKKDAELQIQRLLSYFYLPMNGELEFNLKRLFTDIWKSLDNKTKYKDADKLIPIIFYYYFQNRRFISRKELLEQTDLTREEFNAFTIQISEFLPLYPLELKRHQIFKRFLKLQDEFDLEREFYYISVHLLLNLPSILSTSRDIIAATISILTKLVENDESISVNQILRFFKVNRSTVRYFVIEKIIKEYNLLGFTNLGQSKELLVDFLNKKILNRITSESLLNSRTNKEFRINEFLSVRLEGENSVIYVKGKKFRYCKYLLLNFEREKFKRYEKIDSIDKAEQYLDPSLEHQNIEEFHLTPKQEFKGHCSNLQAWAEHKYDTRILHRNMAFPLLKALTNAGDPLAKRVFKEEIAKRFLSGAENVVEFLLEEDYLKYLDSEETSFILSRMAENNSKIGSSAC